MVFAFVLAAWAPPGWAQALVVQGQGEVRYVSGGIGVDERIELAAMHADFNLHMTFAVKRAGNFIADVMVQIEDAAGRKLVDTVSEGPWLYARLAPGRYRLRATYAGTLQRREFQLRAGRHSELYLYWDDPAANETAGREPGRGVPAEQRQ